MTIDHNQSTPELADRFKDLPAIADCKEYLKLRMMQVTELASQMLCTDPGNLKLMDYLQKQIPATYRLVTEDSPVTGHQEEALSTSFEFEDTNYKAVQVDASGVPLLSDSEVLP